MFFLCIYSLCHYFKFLPLPIIHLLDWMHTVQATQDLLTHDSGLFNAMFTIGNASLAHSGSDKKPIVLENKQADIFNLFLGFILGW